MPIMHVQYPAGGLDGTTKRDLAQRLTDVLLTMEGNAKTAGGRGFAWVIFSEVPAGDWWVGGRLDDEFVAPPGRFLIHVTAPEGYLNAAHKSEVHAMVAAAVLAATGVASEPIAAANLGASVQVIIDEVTEGNWGAGGRTISLAHIADVVGLPKDGERFQWTQSYFAAKARQFAAAGYPSDAGGLLPEE